MALLLLVQPLPGGVALPRGVVTASVPKTCQFLALKILKTTNKLRLRTALSTPVQQINSVNQEGKVDAALSIPKSS